MPVPESGLEAETAVGMDTDTGDTPSDMESSPAVPTAPESVKPSKPIVGIIYPPPEVRNIVDKTASFVARNGPEFESRIKLNEQNNPKFNFLNPGDPYHAYYQHKVKEIKEGVESEETKASELLKTTIDEAKKKKQSELLKSIEMPFVPKEPPADFEFLADPPSISAVDLDIVKLTAQFVARNGRQFLSSLMTREQRNYQFDFLRPQHSLFQYFTKLLEQYTKVLIPPKDIGKKLTSESPNDILDNVKYRANWVKYQEAQRRKEEEEVEKERMAYASIDWHDFVVVETVEYLPFESGNFPPPTTPQEVGARVLMQDRILQGSEPEAPVDQFPAQDDTEVQDMEEDSESSDEEETQQPGREEIPKDQVVDAEKIPPSIEPPRQDKVIIKKDYDPKQSRPPTKEVMKPAAPEEYTISPITGERIPVSKLQEHMRIGLLDPRWREQRERNVMEKVNQESVYAPGFAIDESLKQLAERRSDIFGTGAEEAGIGKKAGEEEVRTPGLPWNPNIGTKFAEEDMEVSEAGGDEEEGRSDSLGPKTESVTTTMSSLLTTGPVTTTVVGSAASQPPVVTVSVASTPGAIPAAPTTGVPPLPGIVRTAGIPGQVPGMPTAQPPPPPGVMLMQGIGQMRPMVGIPQPGFAPFPPGPPVPPRPTINPPTAPPSVPPVPSLLNPNAPIHPTAGAPQTEEEAPPAPKKAKTLEESLIPEDQFANVNPAVITVKVIAPSIAEKPEMGLVGQTLSFSLGIKDTVSALKAKINESIGLAPGKQKLRLTEGLFFKDQNTLAYYNVGPGASIHLSLKERGGRKK